MREEHDRFCLIDVVDPTAECICDQLKYARAEERRQMADNLWSHVQPIVDWIAGVNSTKEAK